jgi:Glycosyltransferase family 9 (heptosyltransferase)
MALADEKFSSPVRAFPQPLWLGRENLQGKTILLHAEQGLGDTIQFCRYASLAANRGAKVLLEVPTALKTLMMSLEGVAEIFSGGQALPFTDYHCPLLSLPLAFNTELQSIPASIPYLKADPELAQAWKAKLGGGDRMKVGLVWAGNPRNSNDHNRSMTLKELSALLSIPVQCVSLQKDPSSADRDLLERSGIPDLGDSLRDFADTAALIANLDLVISVDTAVAHLAGALGKPTWVFIPFVPDWRWMLGREDSPWYPSMRLFRQSAREDWSVPVECIAAQLRQIAKA